MGPRPVVVDDRRAGGAPAHLGFRRAEGVPANRGGDSPENPSEGMLVSTNAAGTVTDVVLEAPEGELPLTMPLRQLGVSTDVVVALDPFLRSVIETGYDRSVGSGAYPDEPEPFRLLPPPDQRHSDAASIAAGLAETKRRLAALQEEDAGADQASDARSLEPGSADDGRHDRRRSSSEDDARDATRSGDERQEVGRSPNRPGRQQISRTSNASPTADEGFGIAPARSAADSGPGAHRSPQSWPVRHGDTKPRAKVNAPRREEPPTSGHRYGAGRQAASPLLNRP